MKFFRTFSFIAFCFIIALLQYLNFENFLFRLAEVNNTPVNFVRWLYLAFIIIAIPLLFRLFTSLADRNSNVTIWCIVMLFYMGISAILFYYSFSINNLVLSMVFPMFPILSLLTTYQLVKSGLSDKLFYAIISLQLITLLLINLSCTFRPELLKYSIYPLISLFPFVLLFGPNSIKIILFIIISTLTILSAKRAGMIALFGGFLLYYTIFLYTERKINLILTIASFPFLGLLIYFVYLKFGENLSYTLHERYYQALETGGSGRIDIWLNTIEEIQKSSYFDKLFGKGYLHYEDVSNAIFNRPHNDILDFLGTYGLIGSIPYFCFLFCIIKTMLKLIAKQHKFAPSFTANTFLFLLFSFFSILSFSKAVFVSIFIFYGYIYAKLYMESKNRMIYIKN